MAPRLSPANPNVNHAVVLAGILLFSLGVLLGAALPVARTLPRRPVGMNMNGFDQNIGKCQLQPRKNKNISSPLVGRAYTAAHDTMHSKY